MTKVVLCIVSAIIAVLACLAGVLILRKQISPKIEDEIDETIFDEMDE